MPQAEMRTPYGSGGHGRWTTDPWGLPAYDYTHADPHPWHQVGNDRITAAASAGEGVQLFTWETGAKWLNACDRGHLAGGFGYLRCGDRILPTTGAPRDGTHRILFGIGYLQREVSAGDLRLRHTLYAPYGDYPFVVSRVDLHTPGPADYFDYWEPHPREMFFTLQPALHRLRSPRVSRVEYDAEAGILWARVPGPRTLPLEPQRRDPWFPDFFLAHRQGPLAGFEADKKRFFGHGGPQRPDTVARGTCSGNPGGRNPCAVLHYRAPAGETRIETAAGYAHAPEEAVEALRVAPSLEQSIEMWRDTLPRWELPEEWVAREATWSAYYLRSSAIYDRYQEAHCVPQGGIYLYRMGVNGAPRDLAQHGWPLIYQDPPMAREVLRFLLRLQSADGELPWDYSGWGMRNLHLMRPSDGGLWLLTYALEYIYATRDFGVLDESFPFHPKHEGRAGSGWDHLQAAWRHLRDTVGVGAHGLIRLGFSDWNDEMAPSAGENPLEPIPILGAFPGLLRMRRVRRQGESTLNTAMACAVLPGFAELARLRGDSGVAREVEEFVAGQREALGRQWRGRWFNRAYYDPRREVGADRLYLDSQVWALLAGVPPEMEALLLDSLRRMSIEPSPLGALSLAPARRSLTSRAGELTSGGVWYLLNMLLVWALSSRDPALAWVEAKRNTLANHAELHPRLWCGTWSGNDSWNAPPSPAPGDAPMGRVPYLKIPAMDYRRWPVQIAHSHGCLLFSLLRLAGIHPGPRGYTLHPRFPFPQFSLRSRLIDLEATPTSISGAIRPLAPGPLEMRVHPPGGAGSKQWTLNVAGKPATFREQDDYLLFDLPGDPMQKTAWRLE
ncbi:MAG: hypothetical protein HY558_02255 [Euryarchaeota archaeon]|nr:hypothetical protein [Euryarchaeota archaeon]